MGMADVEAAVGIGTLLAWPSWRLPIADGSSASCSPLVGDHVIPQL
jgi:hypothetical protein